MAHNLMRSGFPLLVAFATAVSLFVAAPTQAVIVVTPTVTVTVDALCSGSWSWKQESGTLSCEAGTTALVCSPTWSPVSPLPSNPVTISAGANQCPGAATWAWTAATSNVAACPSVPAGSSSSTLNLAAPNSTTPACTYKVAVTGGGKTGTGSASVTWTTATTPALANCRFGSPPGPATAGVGFPATVVCDNGPPTNAATFTWHVYCAGCAETSSQTTTGSKTLTLPTPGTWNVWVDVVAAGNNGTGQTPTASVQVNPAVVSQPGSYDCGPNFANTRTLPLAWTNGVGNIHVHTANAGHFGPNDAVVVEITAPSQIGTSTYGWISYYDSPPAPSAQRVAVLSDQACDFTKGLDGAFRAFTGGNTGTVNFSTIPNDSGLPVMSVPNRKYFLNLKNVPGACNEAYCDLEIEFSVPK